MLIPAYSTHIRERKPSTCTALNDLDDRRIAEIKPLIPPQLLFEDIPLSQAAETTVELARHNAENVISGKDDSLLVIVGPCSVHDVKAAKEYAQRLKTYADTVKGDLTIVMRVYFEKPRTTVGWKGLINDPDMNGTFAINKGLKIGRQLLLEINELGIPAGVEFLDTLTPQYIGDLVSWGAIGARTTESQIHRELSSGLSVPVGFKNGTDGNVGIALDAIKAASNPHHFLSVTKQGLSAIVGTTGNEFCHVILRGGNDGPNYSKQHIIKSVEAIKKANLKTKIMVDCSHGNSCKDHKKQCLVVESVCNTMVEDPKTENYVGDHIIGVMIESNINPGKQSIPSSGPLNLEYGVSVTDACIGWDETVTVLNSLRNAVITRRKQLYSN